MKACGERGPKTEDVFHKMAETTKKVVLRLQCTVCKYKMVSCNLSGLVERFKDGGY